jgi:large subunit ribosomal protein L5
MWNFLDRLVNLALPRVKDFKGVKATSFDNSGNYTLGIKDTVVFPEVDSTKIDKIRGFEITIVISNSNAQKSKKLLELLGMPFEKK